MYVYGGGEEMKFEDFLPVEYVQTNRVCGNKKYREIRYCKKNKTFKVIYYTAKPTARLEANNHLSSLPKIPKSMKNNNLTFEAPQQVMDLLHLMNLNHSRMALCFNGDRTLHNYYSGLALEDC